MVAQLDVGPLQEQQPQKLVESWLPSLSASKAATAAAAAAAAAQPAQA